MKKLLLLLATCLPSGLRIWLWRRLGFSIARGCYVAPFSIVVADVIELGQGAVIETLVLIYCPQKLYLGERARIAGFVRIIGVQGEVIFKQQSFVALGCLIDSTGGVVLGERSHFGPRTTVYSHGTTGMLFNVGYPHRVGPVVIGADCWLGMGCIVHPQVEVGDRVIVLPGLVLRGKIPAEMSVLPPQPEHRLIPTARLTMSATEPVRRRAIESLLHLVQKHLGGMLHTPAGEMIWSLRLANGRRLILLRESTAQAVPSASSSATVVWAYHPPAVAQGVGHANALAYSGAPYFCFSQLTIYGTWSAWGEEVADLMSRHGGTQFAWQTEPTYADNVANPVKGETS